MGSLALSARLSARFSMNNDTNVPPLLACPRTTLRTVLLSGSPPAPPSLLYITVVPSVCLSPLLPLMLFPDVASAQKEKRAVLEQM